MDRTLSPEESLRVITETINKTKENVAKNSFSFLLWGWLMTIASLAFFVLHQFTSFQYYFIPFPLLTGIGIFLTIGYYTRRASTVTQTYMDHFLSRMWFAFGIGFIMVVFVNVSQGSTPFTYTLLLGGLGTLLSGFVLKFRPLMGGGLVLLASAIGSIYVPEDYRALLHGIAIICGYLVPGYLLKSARV